MDNLIINIRNIEKSFLIQKMDTFLNIMHDADNEYWDEDHLLIDLPQKWESSIYAEIDNNLVGFIISSQKKEIFHIHKFFIHSDFRGRKIGSLLLKEFQNIVIEKFHCNTITLKVYKNNKDALNFYYSNNFIIFEQTKDLFLLKKCLI